MIRQALGVKQTHWCEALRSGLYKQQRDGLLHTKNGYCCLGVAQSLFLGESTFSLDSGASLGLPLKRLQDQLRLRGIGGSPLETKLKGVKLESLIWYNDQGVLTFPEIADHLERYAGYYFTEPA